MKKYHKSLVLSAAVVALTFSAHMALAATAASTITTTTVSGTSPAVVTPHTATVVETKTTKGPVTTEAVVSETQWATTEKAVIPAGTRIVNFEDFDYNHDGVLSRAEIGERMFKVYDTDGNEILDNNEFKRRAVITVHPIEKKTVISYDFDGDGVIDQTQMTYEEFMRDTMLARFDKNADGLSPEEFTGRDFMAADINNDKTVDLNEFKASYTAATDKTLKEKAQVNK